MFIKKRQRDKNFKRAESKLKNKSIFHKYDFYSENFLKSKHIQSSLKNNKSLEQFINFLPKITTETI